MMSDKSAGSEGYNFSKILNRNIFHYIGLHGQIPPHGVPSQLLSGDVLHRVAT